MTKALLLIDLQNDYFPGGRFPLWNPDAVAERVAAVARRARDAGVLVVHVQHVADTSAGPAPFFVPDTEGVRIRPQVLDAAPDAPVVVKHYADSFEQTNLEAVLQDHGVTELLVAGMMTQNCVTHTAISKAAEKYDVSVLVDLCTTVDEMIHNIALHALSTRVALVPSSDAV